MECDDMAWERRNLGTLVLVCIFENVGTGWDKNDESHVPVCMLRNRE